MGELVEGSVFGDFRIDHLISDKGGMGDVYEAYQLSVRRRVAAKSLKLSHQNDAEIRRRFEEEALFLAQLNHPNIVNVLAFDPENLIIFMEFLEGMPLDEHVRRERDEPVALSLHESLNIMDQVLAALGHAHAHGLVHRDVKPGNIFVAPDGRVKLTDFGIAKIIGRENLEVTRMGLGSPSYMAPEQILGDEIDGRTDVYAAGIVLYQLLTGKMPFSGRTYEEIIVRHVQDACPSPKELVTDLPHLLCDVVLTATAKKPADRFQSAEAFRRLLAQVPTQVAAMASGGAPATGFRWWPAAAGTALVFAALAALLPRHTAVPANGSANGPAKTPVALKGSLRITTNEAAEIWIGDENKGVSPATLADLPAGRYRIRLVQPEFMALEREATVEAGATASVDAVFPAAGTLTVASGAPGQEVLIDDSPRGSTPLSIKLPVGKHRLKVRGQSREIMVLEGRRQTEAFP
ncbi:MAG: serine/threonine protein kinase [Betaproteobacteria bacterium]|nr:serine/threonine protein kinase [Betaproteobacteria bacterium]